MNNSRKKSLFFNPQSIGGVIIFLVIATMSVYFMAFHSGSLQTLSNRLPDFNLRNNFAGTDIRGNDLLLHAFKSFFSQSTVILGSWLFVLILSLPLSYVVSKKKIVTGIFAELTSFAPSFILFFILRAFFIHADISVVIIFSGLSFLPYSVIKLGKGFSSKNRSLVVYYSLTVLFSVSLFVQLAGFCGLLPSGVLTIGANIKTSLSYAFNFPHLVLPYFILHFLFLASIGLLIRGVKNAYIENIASAIQKAEPSQKEDSAKELALTANEVKETITDIEKIEHEEVSADNSMENKKKSELEAQDNIEYTSKEEHDTAGHTVREINVYEVASKLADCNSIDELERYITEVLVFELEYHNASLYKVLEDGYQIKSLHNKTVPSELIDLEKENREFLNKAFKFEFLNTLKDKSSSYFIYPGKENYDRIFHHLIIDGKVGYIIEVSFNKTLRSENAEIDRLRKFIPECEWEIWRHTSSGYQTAVSGSVNNGESSSDKQIKIPGTPEIEEIIPESFIENGIIETKPEPEKESAVLEKEESFFVQAGEAEKPEDAGKHEEIKEPASVYFVNEELIKAEPETAEEPAVGKKGTDKKANGNDLSAKTALTFINQDFASRYDILLQKGFDFIKEGDFNLALVNLKEALLLDKSSHEALMGIGHIYFEKGLYEEALTNYVSALKINPYSPVAYKYIGNIYFIKNEYEKAFNAYSKLLGLDPGNEEIKAKLEKLKEKSVKK
jgi:tetratricopeptide (TPR) repeat protein